MTQPDFSTLDRPAARAIVSHRHRRTLVCVLERDERVSVAEVARKIARHDQSERDRPLEPSTRRTLTVSLVHNHLPRLDEHDVLEYDADANEVVLTTPIPSESPAAVFERLLEPALGQA